jgi:pyruvate kinase
MYLFNEKQLIHPLCQIGDLPPVEGFIFLRPGDHLRIVNDQIIADHRPMNYAGSDPAVICCTNTDVIKQARKGEPVVLDDGKFRGEIVAKDKKSLTLRMDVVRGGGAKLRAEKGINFPKSRLKIRGLTTKDIEDLQFVAQHADIVSMSFVNSPEDVKDLFAAIDMAKPRQNLGIVLKIETLRAFKNLIPILLMAMQRHPVGVMIARGDLALEVGWKRIAVVQREIMKICHAAHVPDIWATQVFETLAKSGVPSRAEMTDVWVAQRSECVMLNKGPYIIEAIELLNEILMRMDIYHDKDAAMLPSLKKGTR